MPCPIKGAEMKSLACIPVVAALLTPLPALAQGNQPPPSAASERRLSPEQIEAVLAEAAKKREAAGTYALPKGIERASPPPLQGEVGVSVGTGGYREVFGTAIHPMGDDGVAAISVDFVNLGRRRDRR